MSVKDLSISLIFMGVGPKSIEGPPFFVTSGGSRLPWHTIATNKPLAPDDSDAIFNASPPLSPWLMLASATWRSVITGTPSNISVQCSRVEYRMEEAVNSGSVVQKNIIVQKKMVLQQL